MAATDRAYTNLLAHLHNAHPPLPLTTIQSALAHYLANLSPFPTPLAATAVSSTLYSAQPFVHEKLQSLLTAFRHAAHLKHRTLTEDAKNKSRLSNLFTKSLNAALGQWVDDIVKGIQGGNPVLRLASLSGLLLGIHDLEMEAKSQGNLPIELGISRNNVEAELVLAVAEVMDIYSYGFLSGVSGEWEKEFQPSGKDVLTLAMVVASQSLPLVSEPRFRVLPLSTLAHLLVITLSSAFQGGRFLHALSTSTHVKGEYRVHIPTTSSFHTTLYAITSSPVTASVASLSRLAAITLKSLLEGYSNSKSTDGLRCSLETLQILEEMSNQVEQDWITGPLVNVLEQDISPESQPITKALWTALKTMLFSTLMLSEAILAAIVYIPPNSSPYLKSNTSPSGLAIRVLQILSHLSFIISQFGGVTSSSQGFEQLKKTFYLALDIVAQGDNDKQPSNLANTYVKEQCLALNSPTITKALKPVRNAKEAIVLASIEQLVPVLSQEIIETYVFAICYPHLSDPSHRETFESAHSVVLTIFASHAQKQQQHQSKLLIEGTPLHPERSEDAQSMTERQTDARDDTNLDGFVTRMIPFYSRCLIENSVEGRLSTPQLRTAYSALVRCAGAGCLNVDTPPKETLTLAWYCVQSLLDAIQQETPISASGAKGKEIEAPPKDLQRLQRLHLTLISTIPSLPLLLMLRVLEEVKLIIRNYPPSSIGVGSGNAGEEGTREVLVKALFTEILEHVGYREKNAVMQWWYQNRLDLEGSMTEDAPVAS